MSFDIVFEDSTLISKGKDIFFREYIDKITETKVKHINIIDNFGFENGLNKQLEMSLKLQIGCCHQDIGIS